MNRAQNINLYIKCHFSYQSRAPPISIRYSHSGLTLGLQRTDLKVVCKWAIVKLPMSMEVPDVPVIPSVSLSVNTLTPKCSSNPGASQQKDQELLGQYNSFVRLLVYQHEKLKTIRWFSGEHSVCLFPGRDPQTQPKPELLIQWSLKQGSGHHKFW